jgi:hypothetical protein
MLIALLVMLTGGATAVARAVVRTLSGILRWWTFVVIVFSCFSFLYVTYTEYPVVWLSTARFYNGNIGPLVHTLVVIPLKIGDVLLRGFLPLWNAVWWFFKALVTQGFVPILVQEAKIILQMATTTVSLVQHLSNSLTAFVEAFFCVGEACLHPEKGVLDLLSPMGDVREFVALSIQLLRQFCSTMAAPVDVLAFPLLDLNLAEGVHHLGNAVIQLLVVIPRATVVRCGLVAGNQFDVLMCTPDLAPFFNFLVAGVSGVGQAVDNWANAAFLIVESVWDGYGASSRQCDLVTNAMIPDLVMASQRETGQNGLSVVVGLTDWLYAVTDGVTAVYMGLDDPTQGKTQAWPYQGMDVSMGVAAVTYSNVHDLDVSAFSSGKTSGAMQTTAMLACNCTDVLQLGMQILCSILPMAGVPLEAALEDYLLQVMFPDPLAAGLYTCSGVDVYVKSVRWSFTRYSSQDATLGSGGAQTTLPVTDCIARGTCRELDATVWVVPRCGQEQNQNDEKACIADAPCFPFCMAARRAGSGRDNLILAGASRWREGLAVLGQDCALATSSAGTVGTTMESRGVSSWTTIASSGVARPRGVANGIYASTYQGQECQRAPRVNSVVDANITGSRAAAANVRLGGQPFAITGDTALMEVLVSSTTVSKSGGGMRAVEEMSGSVQVERLMGNEVDAFRLHPLAQTLPTLQRVFTPMSEAERVDSTRVTVPYSYGTTRIAATNSRNYVFYASNPNLDVFGAYFEYCSRKDQTTLARAGLLVKSSFAPMRIYRVSAYRRCAAYSCGADLVRFVTIDGFDEKFDQKCEGVFNVSVVAMEYLNEDNIAVTVQSSHYREYDTRTLRFGGARTKWTTYWLNPSTMGLRPSIWQTAVPASNFATLCPSMQRLPRVGTFGAELANSAIFLVQMLVSGVLYTPGMVKVWQAGGGCPPVGGAANYHSVLGGCGAGLYSLDDFFDSTDDAAAVFWHSLSLLGKLVAAPEGGGSVMQPLTQVLDGTSQYGEAMIDLWSARASVLTLTRVPIKDQVDQLWASMQPASQGGVRPQGLAYGSSVLSGWSRFSYKALSVISTDLVKRLLDTTNPDPLTVKRVFQLIWAHLYDLKDEFDATITAKTRMGCAGLRLVFGTDNPWAAVLYHQCAATAELTSDLWTGVALNMFVLIPMAKCVCKESRGHDIARFVKETCAPPLPVALLPMLYTIANEARALQQDPLLSELQCASVLAYVRTEISQSLDSWFENQHLSLIALGNSVDYATATFDSNAGKCMDFTNDPHVVVLVPQPVDYFQRCAATTLCKGSKCALEWARFQQVMRDAMSPASKSTTMSVSTESAFFPGTLDETLTVSNAIASVEVPPSLGVCLRRAITSPPDYVLAVAELTGVLAEVTFWCAPLMSSSGVYKNLSSGYSATLPGTVLSLQFGDDTGGWMAGLVQQSDGQKVFLVNRTGVYPTPSLTQLLGTNQVLMRVENMWMVEGGILLDLVTRRMLATGSTATGMGMNSLSEAVHLFLVPPLQPLSEGGGSQNTSSGVWYSTDVDLMQFGGGQYWYTRQEGAGHEYLFLPRIGRGGMNVYRLKLGVLFGVRAIWLSLEETVDLGAGADLTSLGSTAAVATVSQRADYVLSASPSGWNWLKQTRLDPGGFVAGVYGSAKVDTEATIEGNCNELSCEGCATLQIQRLCLAFNQCALVNCVGTPVHQLRPLCGIGGLLKRWGEMSLQSTHGAWTIFTEMLGLSLELNMLTMREARLLWPEDAFLCYVCEAKDATAEFFSILTATVNSALQLGEANIAYMYGGASNVDTNADAALTISSTALNGFMNQVALLPLYLMISSRQVMMCQVTGVLALLDKGGFKLSLKTAGQASASDIIAGQCLTVGAEVLANYPGDSPSSVAATVGSIASNAAQLLLIQQIEPMLHFMDAMLAYTIGVVHALGVLVMSQNMARCNPPTFHLGDVLRCACDDHRLQIPDRARAQTAVDGALWCSGVLSMVDSNNKPYFVYNKFTYAQIQALNADLDAYATCVGTGTAGYKCKLAVPPIEDGEQFFRQQGVTVANVLVRCRENYARKQWDPYAFVLYNREYQAQIGKILPIPDDDPYSIKACMQQRQDPTSTGSLSQACLQEFLGKTGMREEDYWAYERVDTTDDAAKAGSQYTDACLVFSGPADLKAPLFVDCVDGSQDQCRLAGHAWTPLSENQVPVAAQHRVLSYGLHSAGLVQRLYEAARAKVVSAVDASVQQQGANSDHIDMEFFSVEGDVLHQTMDCLFMGPYSRVDYWPTPACDGEDEEECLVGPYWARDEGSGAQRGVDPDTCPTPRSLPYTCGSPSRKAIMRYLIKDVLTTKSGNPRNQNGSVMHETLIQTLQEIRAEWGNTSGYGCPCAEEGGGSGALAPTCCKGWVGNLLPEHLNKSYMPIDSTKVLQAMADDLGGLYDTALEDTDPWRRYLRDVAPGEDQMYAAWRGSQRVQDEARFDPTQPVSSYTSSEEGLAPLNGTYGTLWDVCHAALKQTFFTLPLGVNGGSVVFDAELSAFDGDPAKLEGYVRNFTWEAWRHSPLFRHYSPRHIPSTSGMCAHESDEKSASWTRSAGMSYAPFKQRGKVLVPSADLPSDIPVFHPQQFTVGDDAVCLCGWTRVNGSWCLLPSTAKTDQLVCAVRGMQCVRGGGGEYAYQMTSATEAVLMESFSSAWFCPEFQFSAHWGFMDAPTAEAWLRGGPASLTTSSRDLLQNGRAGVRIGNVKAMAEGETKESINPTSRRVPLERGKLTTCTPPPALGNVSLDSIVDELFPAAQAVDESGAAAYCVRYVIEMARLEILTLAGASEEATTQQERVGIWSRRCGAQLHLLHLCTNLGVYRERLEPAYCNHFALSAADPLVRSTGAYVTRECLVGVRDGGTATTAFYDPCRCVQCVGGGATTKLDLGFVMRTAQCMLRFDPRGMLKKSPSVGWVDGFHPLRLSSTSDLLRDEFAREIMADADAVGNTADTTTPWWLAEGHLMTPRADSGDFCDGVVDWWPETWDYPVGYHVTVPCEASDTAYRSFAQAFALDPDENLPTLVYQHDLLRDANFADSHFGVGGLCRRGNFGMGLYETNNMRYCTSLPAGENTAEDFTVSRVRDSSEVREWTEMKCTQTSHDLPWPSNTAATVTRYDSSFYSIGTVPNMPSEEATVYPETLDDMMEVGPWQEITKAGGAWGRDGEYLCQDYDLALCGQDDECPLGYRCRGMVCSGDPTRRCTNSAQCGGRQSCHGVCLDSNMADCIRHSDCADPRFMCSGVGKCVQPVLVVQNRLEGDDNNISLGMMVGQSNGSAVDDSVCGTGARAYSLVGASYWGNTADDLLRVHGMCSFEDWFKYTDYYGKGGSEGGCATPQSDGTLRLDPKQCNILNLNQRQGGNQSKWWQAGGKRPELMYLRPTNCDRDYERVQGFTQCTPDVGTAALRFQGDTLTSATEYDLFVRLHTDDGKLLLADMPEHNDTDFGVLGLGGVITRATDLLLDRDVHPFTPCALLGQCFGPTFTVNGAVQNRTFFSDSLYQRVRYDDATVFKCGVFGLEDPTRLGCKLDTEVLPLYRALCLPDGEGGIRQCKTLASANGGGVTRLCENIRRGYQPTNLDRTTNLENLKELFYAFPDFNSVDEYLSVTECMGLLHADIKGRAQSLGVSRGLYFPLMFVLKELPFDWFYQCIVMAGGRVNEETWRAQDCVAYTERALHTTENYQSVSSTGGDSIGTYLRYVRGGYTKAQYEGFRNEGGTRVLEAVRAARRVVQRKLYPSSADGSTDASYPICSQNMVWKIGPFGAAYSDADGYNPDLRAIISNWFDPQQCRASWHTGLISDLPSSLGITTQNWMDRLTVPDPSNTEPQAVVEKTIMDHIQYFMLEDMDVVIADSVSTNQKGVFFFNNSVPSEYDLVKHPLTKDLIPTASFRQGVVYVDNDDSISRTCAFLPDSDPLFLSRAGGAGACETEPQSGVDGRFDTLKRCGGTLCTNVPVLARKGGLFNCRYQAEGNIIPVGCTQANGGACYTGVVAAMYAQVMKEYRDSATGREPPRLLEAKSLPWFDAESLFRGGDWSFSLASELDYERNIQPNPELSIMCDITKTNKDSAIKYMECTNPHYQRLKEHVKTHYKREGGVVIPSGAQLEWPVERGVLARGVILSYTRTTRQLNQTFIDALFDDETVCKGVVTGTQRVCWKKSELEFASVNPWLLGNFNPFEACDVDFTDNSEGGQEYVYAQCLKEDNPAARCDRFLQKQVSSRCVAENRKLVSFPGVPRYVGGASLDYNLCYHRLAEDAEGCLHDQGLLGGFDGSPVAAPATDETQRQGISGMVSMLVDTKYENTERYVVGNSLYEESEWSIPDDFRQGFYAAGRNPLWYNGSAPYGHLQIQEGDIGGHRIGVVVSRADGSDVVSVMAVERLPMGATSTNTGFLDGQEQKKSLPTSVWVPGLQAAMAAEDEEAKRLHTPLQEVSALGPSCPLQRWMFYSGGYTTFSPEIPAAKRSQHLFHGIHGGKLSHPTMQRASRGEFLGRYRSANGFCACPVIPDIDQPQCRVPSDAESLRVCSLAQTIATLKGGAQVWESHVFPPLDHARATRRCGMQLDWPSVNGTLRDGSFHSGEWTKASSPTHKECHVLDRFLPFRYQYRKAAETRLAESDAEVSTINAGVCQTARVVTLQRAKVPARASRCLRKTAFVPNDQSATVFTCDIAGEKTVSMTRRVRLTVQETLERRKWRRTKCGQCAPVPRFRTSGGADIPAESSFGRLYRHSTERMLAKDLKDALRGVRFNQTAWRRGEFMHAYMFRPRELFIFDSPTPNSSTLSAPQAQQKGPDDSHLWGKPWVYCPSSTALKTGEGCVGSMSRQDWVERKTALCPQLVRSYSTNPSANSVGTDPLARTPFCNLDNSTDLVCKAIAEAKTLVIQANCIARGDDDCMPSPFVYHPASYVPSNNAWVHDSVQAFYLKVNASCCPASTVSDQQQRELLDFARQYQLTCPANALTLVKQILAVIRVIITDVALLVSSILSMLVKLLALLVTGNVNQIKNSVLDEWDYIQSKGHEMLHSMSDIMVDAMLNSGLLGVRIKTFLQNTCEKINSAVQWFLNVW